MKRMALVYIFSNLFNVWPNRESRPLISASVFNLVLEVLLVEVHEEFSFATDML